MVKTRRYLQDPALRYLGGAVAWGLGTLLLLRIGWVESQLLLPFTAFQERVACAVLGDPTGPIQIGLSCSAADVIALCVGAVLAYPVAWRRRLTGAVAGLLLIVALNTLRIGTLGRVAADHQLFSILHLYVWPGVLVVAVSLYVFAWMRGSRRWVAPAARHVLESWARSQRHPLRRFALWAAGLTILYLVVAAPLAASAAVQTAASWVALTAASIATLLGIPAAVSGQLFRTPYGAFLVTPACVLTPLIPIYLAAVLALPLRRGPRAAALLAAPALFFALGTGRLLVLVLPQTLVHSHLTALHAFYQVLLAAMLVVVFAYGRRSEQRRWMRRAAAALAGGAALGVLAGPLYTRALGALAHWIGGDPPAATPDSQGALLILPAFQLALLAAFWLAAGAPVGWRPAAALAILAASQIVLLVGLAGLWTRLALQIPPLQLRAWAVAAPVAAAWLTLRRPRAPAASVSAAASLSR